jgi:hypothetical protein
VLGPQPQHRPAGGQDRHTTTAGQQPVQVASDLQHLLQVVEDEQPGAVAELLDQGLQRRVCPRQVDPDRPGDAGQDQLRLGGPGQGDEHGAGTEPVTQTLAHRHRQTGLANPARPGQGHQPHLGLREQAGDLVDGVLPPHQ